MAVEWSRRSVDIHPPSVEGRIRAGASMIAAADRARRLETAQLEAVSGLVGSRVLNASSRDHVETKRCSQRDQETNFYPGDTP